MPTFVSRVAGLREHIAELVGGELLILGYLTGGAGEHDGAPAFRTLVQFDGDIITQIRKQALADPRFDVALAAHRKDVEAALRERPGQLRRWIRISGVVAPLLLGVLGLASNVPGDFELLPWMQRVGLVFAGSVGAAVWFKIRRRLVPVLLRRIARKCLAGHVLDTEPQRQREASIEDTARLRRAKLQAS